jgi:hypothetical protein
MMARRRRHAESGQGNSSGDDSVIGQPTSATLFD